MSKLYTISGSKILEKYSGKTMQSNTLVSYYFQCFQCLLCQLYIVDITISNSHIKKLRLSGYTLFSKLDS